MGKIPEITDLNERAFLDGVLEVYQEIFSQEVPFYFLDREKTDINPYGETTQKIYKEPVYLTARVQLEAKDGEKAINRTYLTAKITVPTQSFWDNNIAVTAKDIAEMRKGKFVFNNMNFEIVRVQPRTQINNTYIVYKFYCREIFDETDYGRDCEVNYDGTDWGDEL